MTIEEIKEKLRKKAVIFKTGGIRPTNALSESWIGSVRWKKEGEELPTDQNGRMMTPLACIFIKGLPYIPEELNHIALISIFMSKDVFECIQEMDLHTGFAIRTYADLDQLIPCQWDSDWIKPFPLVPELVENDFPVWDQGGIPDALFHEIIALEESEDIEYFEDICEEIYANHKVGGYPAFCQSGYWFGDGYEYVLQISSDEKAHLNIVDSGSFYFFYQPEKQDWKVYCDFY